MEYPVDIYILMGIQRYRSVYDIRGKKNMFTTKNRLHGVPIKSM